MSYPTATEFTIGVLALMAIVGTLAAFVGFVVGKQRDRQRDDQVWSDGFNAGAGADDKTRRIGERARRLGR